MTIDEPHDHRRRLFDENHAHGVPDKRGEGHESTPNPIMSKHMRGLTDEDRKAVADRHEKHRKDTKRAGLTPPTRTVRAFPRVKSNDAGETYGPTQVTTD